MTLEELKKIPFKMVAHLNMANEHCSTYRSNHPGINIEMCVHQPYKHGKPQGKSYTHYKWNGQVYKSIDKLISDINQEKNETE